MMKAGKYDVLNTELPQYVKFDSLFKVKWIVKESSELLNERNFNDSCLFLLNSKTVKEQTFV